MPKPRVSLDSVFVDQVRSEYSLQTLYLVGVSGGRDSMALLHFLNASGFENLIVCHVNHGLRGEASAADAVLVEHIADELGYRYESLSVDVAALAQTTKQSIELAARNARHGFFAEMSAKHDCSDVFLGHHADDQVETVLINLFRGCGMRGLGGIQPSSNHLIDGRDLTFHRPFLEVWREEIDHYCNQLGIPFRDDESNFDAEFALRNRVRNTLIPELSDVFGRDVRGAVERLARVLQMEEAVRESQIDTLYPRVETDGMLDSKALAGLGEADQFRVVARWLAERAVPDCGFAEIERVLELLSDSGDPAKINLPGDYHARRRVGRIFLESNDPPV